MSRQDLARASKVGYSTIAEIENEGISASGKTPKLTSVLNINAQWLASGEGPRELSNVAPGPAIRGTVPLISWVQAGDFTEVYDPLQPGEGERIPTTAPIHEHTFALRVHGDSMSPRFPEGMLLVVEPDREPHPGDFVIAKNGGDATFKQYVKDGGDYLLKPLNPQYPTKPLAGSRIIGVVVQATAELV